MNFFLYVGVGVVYVINVVVCNVCGGVWRNVELFFVFFIDGVMGNDSLYEFVYFMCK